MVRYENLKFDRKASFVEVLAVRPEILQQGTLLADIQRSALLLCHSAMIQRGDQALDALLQFWRLHATAQAAQKKGSYQVRNIPV